MKWVLPLLLVLAISCGGDQELPVEQEVRDGQAIEVTDFDYVNALNKVCEALKVKASNIRILSASPYTFSYAQKSCSKDQFSTASDIVTRIEGNSYFKPTNSESFIFSEIEFNDKGVMKEICEQLKTQKEKIVVPVYPNGLPMWVSIGPSRYCQADNVTSVCVFLEYGVPANGSYLIQSYEWIKFQLSGDKVGFFTDRRFETFSGCKDKQKQAFSAVLK